MNPLTAQLELDATSYPGWRDGIVEAEASGAAAPREPRTYAGYPRSSLQRLKPRRRSSLDRVLLTRRSARELGTDLPTCDELSRLLQLSHGITGQLWSGPVPSAGGLQSLELYAAILEPDWLGAGTFHYDRVGHHLSRLSTSGSRETWSKRVPSLGLVQGGSILWIIVGDGERVSRKYGDRAARFLLQESGHLMQNLCLVSTTLGLVTVPLGGYCEREVARELQLLDSDLVLYVGLCGHAITD
jgi:SagB-type dehydrogenase family enzyme